MADNVKNIWSSYSSAVIASGVPEKNADWFVLWVQEFSRFIKGKSLQERSEADIRINAPILLFLAVRIGHDSGVSLL